MNFHPAIFAMVLIPLLSTNCNNTKELFSASKDFNRFPQEIQIKDSTIYKSSVAYERMQLYQDSVLFLGKAPSRTYSPAYYDVMNLNTKALTATTARQGRRTGETLGFLSGNIIDNYLWGHDVNKRKIFYYNIDSVQSHTRQMASVEYPIKKDYHYLAPLAKEKVLAYGDYTHADHLLDIIDLNTGNVERSLFPYNEISGKPVSIFEKSAYESSLYAQPGGRKAVLARKYADEIAVIDITTETLKKTGGPDGFAPALTRGMNDNKEEVAMMTGRTRYAFVRGQVTKQYIYLLYSGNMLDTPHKYFGNCIYVYDWDGNPVKKLLLKNYVQHFAVNSDNKVLYLLSTDGTRITVANLL